MEREGGTEDVERESGTEGVEREGGTEDVEREGGTEDVEREGGTEDVEREGGTEDVERVCVHRYLLMSHSSGSVGWRDTVQTLVQSENAVSLHPLKQLQDAHRQHKDIPT